MRLIFKGQHTSPDQMLVSEAVTLYHRHRISGEHPRTFFRRALLATHPDKVQLPRWGLPDSIMVVEARQRYHEHSELFQAIDRPTPPPSPPRRWTLFTMGRTLLAFVFFATMSLSSALLTSGESTEWRRRRTDTPPQRKCRNPTWTY